MSKVDATHWAISLNLPLGKTINYKYTRGSWDSVQKDPLGREINNLQYTLPDSDGAQVTIFDSVASWRDLAPPANAVAVQWSAQAWKSVPWSPQPAPIDTKRKNWGSRANRLPRSLCQKAPIYDITC